ncbi:MAG: hypothetical protein PHW03_09435 [Eubacteriales bacterium]|nr:hypothetical protein [Eubacteriales bacterium]
MSLGDMVEGSLTKSNVISESVNNISTLDAIIGIISVMAPAIGGPLSVYRGLDIPLGEPSVKAASILASAGTKSSDETLHDLSDLASETGKEAYEQYLELLDVLQGNTARIQLESIMGSEIGPDAVITSRVFDQIALVTNLNVGIQVVGIISEIMSIGQIDQIGKELRSYLDYSGLAQITGYGYGQILASVLGQSMAQEMLAVTRSTQPGLQDLVTLRMRAVITPEEYITRASKLGYTDDIAEKLYTIAQFYPQVQDWIRFSVRDVFNPSVIASAQLDNNFPTDIVPDAEKAGVSEEVLKWYWRAHWQLPSPNQAYEMYHRGYITRDGLHDLLVAADYAPGYIDAYMGIAETPYTRVDARRMLSAGVLTNDEYKRAMMDIGYSDDKAQKLLEWALNEDGTKDKDLSIAQYMRGYDLGLVTENELRSYVQKQGYDDVETDTLVSMHIIDFNDKKVSHSIKYYDKLYQRSDISDAEYLTALNKLAIPLSRAQEMLTIATQKKVMAQKMPTKADILKWYTEKHITADDAFTWLQRIGYPPEIAKMYISYSGASEDSNEEES